MNSPRETLLETLQAALPPTPGVAVIHSSLRDLLPPLGFTAWDAAYAVSRLVDEGWTLAFPAFTFSFCRGVRFDLAASPSETGILADWVRQHLPQAQRTPHPIYSFVVVGSRSDEILNSPSTTTFGNDSPFGFFEREDATIISLGCGFHYFTQLHRYEQEAAVPYRYFKTFTGRADLGAGDAPTSASMFVRDLDADPVNDFSSIESTLRAEGQVRAVPLWRGVVESLQVRALALTCRAALSSDPFSMVSNGPEVARRLSVARQARSAAPLRMAVLGRSNVHHLEAALRSELTTLMPERRLELAEIPFGQVERMIIDPTSELNRFAPQQHVFCDRIEDLAGPRWIDAPGLHDIVRRHGELISRHAEVHGGWIIVHRFAALAPAIDADLARRQADEVARCNQLLDDALSAVAQVVWVDLASEAAAFRGEVTDPRLWHVGRFPYSQAFSRHLARRWAGLVLSVLGKTARLVVLDLDNTLWGGVLGEDGMDGVAIGGDYPGNAFAEFQRDLRELTNRGIALAVCSKNDDDLAMSAIDGLPSMVIRSSDLSARRINWQPKSQNIREIAAELNLGLESVMFIDDNPVEREAVRRNLPGVRILDLPTDPALYSCSLADSPFLAAATVTAEDRKRIRSFEVRRGIEAARGKATNLTDYYASLGMTLHMLPLDAGNGQRAAQLANKTNQFNATTRRYDLRDLQKLAKEGADVVVLALEDRMSKAENIGLMILKPADEGGVVDTYLLSCRVLGRGIETAALGWAVRRAARRGWPYLDGVIVETERNMPVRSVYRDAGFSAGASPGTWRVDTRSPSPAPEWLQINDRLEHAPLVPAKH